MDNHIVIKSIAIINFRSIRRLTLKVCDFNIFVGMNDAGKSNVLKALNLFFNNQVDNGIPFDYKRDFTYLYPDGGKEAKAVTIIIQFEVPKTFSGGGLYKWKKVWKDTGLTENSITTSDGNPPAPRSRIPTALQKIKYRYVPAVKSREYYKSLLVDLYTSVSASLDPTLEEAVNKFSSVLGTYTENITNDVSTRLGISSQLTVPGELSEIFKALIFMTNREADGISVPLNSRGDGIQARHIPIILKYIAEEDQRSRNQGSTKVTTIWGFEEPENGMELSNAFLMADEFTEYSKELQIFITTHSPAFYMKKETSGVNVYYVEKKGSLSEETSISLGKSSSKIANEMGLMPLIAPFVAEQAEKYRIAQKIYLTNYLTDIPTILVEGETDIEYLKIAISHKSEWLSELLEQDKLRVVCKNDGAGCSQLSDWVMAWIYSGFKSPMMAVLDKDEAGNSTRNKIVSNEAYKARHQQVNIKIVQISPTADIIKLYQNNISIPYEIEHLCSFDVWREWQNRGYLSNRNDEDIIAIFKGKFSLSKTPDEVIDECVTDKESKKYLVQLEPKDLKKKQMLGVVKKYFSNKESTFDGFEKTIAEIENFFSKFVL